MLDGFIALVEKLLLLFGLGLLSEIEQFLVLIDELIVHLSYSLPVLARLFLRARAVPCLASLPVKGEWRPLTRRVLTLDRAERFLWLDCCINLDVHRSFIEAD